METLVSAVISAAATLAVCLITNNAQQAKTRALIEYQLTELTKRVDRHNNVIERTFILEGRMTEAEHDIRDLKGGKQHG